MTLGVRGMHLHVVLGNQLFDPGCLSQNLSAEQRQKTLIYMREDRELCTYFAFHKQKIICF